MPTNVTAEYKKAEQAFRDAREPAERLQCLKEMLRTIPKHKGTEHLQRDIKTRMKMLKDELAGPKKGGTRTGPVHSIRREGAAQIAMIGPPNSGKSELHRALTGARSEVGMYPFTTRQPLPGMMPFEDIYFQLVDLPPISIDYFEPWLVNALQPANAALLIIDISDPACIDHIQHINEQLGQRKIFLTNDFQPHADIQSDWNSEESDPFRIDLPTLLVANKIDLTNGIEELDALDELLSQQFPSAAVSATTGFNLDRFACLVFQLMNIVRVYTKVPGKPADTDRPFTLTHGGTVFDVARQVHKTIADQFQFARIWGKRVYDGQQVGPDHVLEDLDIIELHVR